MNYWWLFFKIIFIYFLLIVILRFLGKREVGQLSIFDLVILLIIADIASMGIDNDEVFLASLMCLFILAILQKVLSLILLRFSKLRGFCDGNPTIIVYNGVLNIRNMKKELYTIDDLISQMRLEHIMDISQIRLAILETNGALSIIKNHEEENLTLPIILSGNFVDDNLKCLDIKREEIERIFIKKKINIRSVIYCSYSEDTLRYYYRNSNKQQELRECKIRL